MLGDGLAEGLSFLRVAQGIAQGSGRDAGTACGDVDASEFESADSLLESAALDAADQLVGGDPMIYALSIDL